MEYFRDRQNKIQADFSYRLGIILSQYESLLPSLEENKKYDSTLYICALQSLLTYCSELIKEMSNDHRLYSFFNASIMNDGYFNLGNIVVRTYSPSYNLKIKNLIAHLRNSLSHPTQFEPEGNIKSTGYTTIKDESNRINKYIFIDSPDIRNKKDLRRNKSDIRIVKIEIEVWTLKAFVVNLCNLLSQPIKENWNGIDVTQVI